MPDEKYFSDNKVEKLDSGKVEKEINWNKKTLLNASTDSAASKINTLVRICLYIFFFKKDLSYYFLQSSILDFFLKRLCVYSI